MLSSRWSFAAMRNAIAAALGDLARAVAPPPALILCALTEDPRQGQRAADIRPPTPAVQPRLDQTGTASPPAAHPALPRPTYWPAVLAFGITLFAWGFVTTFYITLAGLLIIFLALGGWIGDLLHEH